MTYVKHDFDIPSNNHRILNFIWIKEIYFKQSVALSDLVIYNFKIVITKKYLLPITLIWTSLFSLIKDNPLGILFHNLQKADIFPNLVDVCLIFTPMLNYHAPEKKRVRGNHKPWMNEQLKIAIIKHSQLKNKTNKIKKAANLGILK